MAARNLAIAAGALLLAACASSEKSLPAPISAGLTWNDIVAMPLPPAGKRLPYGKGPQQFGELRMPAGAGPHPVAVVIHGGCWLSAFDYRHITNLSSSLTNSGVATWTIEYRRVGDSRGGWPGTFQDVSDAIDHLRVIALQYPIDLARIIAVGHSAGGQLALWAAGRSAAGGELHPPGPLSLTGVVGLAAITDLRRYGDGSGQGCRAGVRQVLGGTPEEVPERYAQVSPVERPPLKLPVRLIHGLSDELVPLAQAERFAAAGSRQVKVIELRGVGHFDLVVPNTAAWQAVQGAVLELAELKSPVRK